MPKFRTVITHKPSHIEIAGHSIELKPDAGGICTFDVPEDRPDVAERLRNIPEGFTELADETPAKPAKQVPAAPTLVSQPSTESTPPAPGTPDLDAMEKEELAALAKTLGIQVHHNAGASGLRAKIREAQSS